MLSAFHNLFILENSTHTNGMTICMYIFLQGELLTGSAILLKSGIKTSITFSDLNVIFSTFVIASITSFVTK